MHGFRKWALGGYLVLTVYLLARPTNQELTARASAMDERLKAQPTHALCPALAETLGMPESSIERYLQTPKARPSELVFSKLLDRDGQARGRSASDEVAKSGLSVKETIRYLDSVEKRLHEALQRGARATGDDLAQRED